MTTKLIEAGCDWFTGTSQSESSAALMMHQYRVMKEELAPPRAAVKDASWFGYYGWRFEHVFFGERQGQWCIMLSGWAADRYAHAFADVGARASRLDLQATFYEEHISEEISREYDRACLFKPPTGHPPAVTVLRGRNHDYQTLYVGRRASETFLRVYNKWEESKDPYYRNGIRYEAELKGQQARTACGKLESEGWAYTVILGLLKGYLAYRGVDCPFLDDTDAVVLRKTRVSTSTEGKMSWLLTQVSPTIQALIEEVGFERVAAVLFPDGIDKHRVEEGSVVVANEGESC
jgi:DNA relaxase NicK